MIQRAVALSGELSVAESVSATGIARSRLYRWKNPRQKPPVTSRPAPSRALAPAEKDRILAVLNSARFWDKTPRSVYASLLDEGA
jgi:putative transposase